MGKLFVSASEMETWFLCNRKWAGIYIHGLRGPSGKGAAFGSSVHKVFEDYLRDGTPLDLMSDEGLIASEGLHLIPAPKSPGLFVELEFNFTAPGAWFTGKKDYVVRLPGRNPKVGDHKTTGDKRYIKTEEEILWHPQAILYAADEFRVDPEARAVDLEWTYYPTRGKKEAIQRWQTVERNQIADLFFERLLPVARHLEILKSDEDLNMLELEPSFNACEAFGGCHLIDICRPTPIDRMNAIMSQSTLLQKLQSGTPIVGGPAPGAPPQPQAGPPPGWTPPPAPGAPPPGWDQAFAPGASPQPPHLQQQTTQSAPPPAQYQPPQAPPPAYAGPAAQQYQPPPGGPPAGYPPAPPIDYAPPPHIAPQVVPAQPWTPPPRVDAPEKPVKTRAKKAEVIDGSAAQPGGFTLYVGCLPVGGQHTLALEYCDAANTLVCQEQNVAHYKLIEYGKGGAALQIACKKLIDANPLAGDVVLMKNDLEFDCLPVFRMLAAKVVVAL